MVPLRFAVGRLRARVFRPPALDGWLAEEGGPARRGELTFVRLEGGRIGAQAPGTGLLVFSAEASEALAGDEVTVLVGWPEAILVVRRGGVVVHGEGDLFHFGDLVLDAQRTLRRTGYEYLSPVGADVRVRVELEERSWIDVNRALRRTGFDIPAREEPNREPRADGTPSARGPSDRDAEDGADRASVLPKAGVVDVVDLAPGSRTRFGPYELENERSFDYGGRPIAGETGHAYVFRLRRLAEEPVGGRAEGLPDPLNVRSPEEVLVCARRFGLLSDDEVLVGENALLKERLALFEGSRAALEQALQQAGGSPPRLSWRGDVLEATASRLARNEHGVPLVGLATVALAPVGLPVIRRETFWSLPGRMRRRGGHVRPTGS